MIRVYHVFDVPDAPRSNQARTIDGHFFEASAGAIYLSRDTNWIIHFKHIGLFSYRGQLAHLPLFFKLNVVLFTIPSIRCNAFRSQDVLRDFG